MLEAAALPDRPSKLFTIPVLAEWFSEIRAITVKLLYDFFVHALPALIPLPPMIVMYPIGKLRKRWLVRF